MPKSTQKQQIQYKLSFQQKLLQIAKKTLPEERPSGILICPFDKLPGIRIYSHSTADNKEGFFLAIKKLGRNIQYFTQEPDPTGYFKLWQLKLEQDNQQYYCVLGKGPIVEGKTPYESCREIIKSLQTTAARSKTTQQVAPSHNIFVQPLTREESEAIDNDDDIAEEIIALFSKG